MCPPAHVVDSHFSSLFWSAPVGCRTCLRSRSVCDSFYYCPLWDSFSIFQCQSTWASGGHRLGLLFFPVGRAASLVPRIPPQIHVTQLSIRYLRSRPFQLILCPTQSPFPWSRSVDAHLPSPRQLVRARWRGSCCEAWRELVQDDVHVFFFMTTGIRCGHAGRRWRRRGCRLGCRMGESLARSRACPVAGTGRWGWPSATLCAPGRDLGQDDVCVLFFLTTSL